MKDHHGEWMSLLEISGPFLTTPVLERAFPQGLDPIDTDIAERLQLARAEWRESQDDKETDSAEIHDEWIEFVLRGVLGFDDEVLRRGDGIPKEMIAEIQVHHARLVPDFVIVSPSGSENAGTPRMLISKWPFPQKLNEIPEGSNWAAPPAERMELHCRAVGVRLGLVTNGQQWVLVDAKEGRVTTYVSWHSHLWIEEKLTLRSFTTLLNARRFFGVAPDVTLAALLDESVAFQEELTDQLGYQVRRAVEVLVQALDRADLDRNRKLLEGVTPAELYEAALTVMMRLVFLFCAEERGLLLLGDQDYDAYYAVSPLRAQLREEADLVGVEVLERRQDAWTRFLSTVRAVHGGIEHDTLRMPALGSSLFDPDRFPFLEGRPKGTSWLETPASPLPIDNRTVLHLLESLQLLQMKGSEGKIEARKLSFRALDVEQIGYVYEGLLDHVAEKATTTMVGLRGGKDKEAEVSLETLETERNKGERYLIGLLKEKTGRSDSALRNALARQADEAVQERLLVACGNDYALLERILPYHELIRDDVWVYPQIYRAGSFMVTGGPERRETGTHYTPKFLTEKIVAETLEPVVYVGPSEGKPRDEWVLRPPAELLELKICDLAMGSGAFLVQACRWLSERLLEAWDAEEKAGRFITMDGDATGKAAGADLMPSTSEDRRDYAKRLIAERCLYGVDINPMAVELAKLSLWLVTLAKNRPFGFLDHNLRSGDSLLGLVDIRQLLYFHPDPSQGKTLHRTPLFDQTKKIAEAIREATELREKIRKTRVLDIEDVRTQAQLEGHVKRSISRIRVAADYLMGCAISTAGGRAGVLDRQLIASIDKVVRMLTAAGQNGGLTDIVRAEARNYLDEGCPERIRPRRPHHWSIEFPEVFSRESGGFDAIIGNPPFLGGKKITGTQGVVYRNYLIEWLANGEKGSADLVSYFFLHAYDLLRNGGNLGLLAVNTIAEGDTRQVGLEQMVKNGAAIYAAFPNEPWSGKAAVITSRVHIHKGKWKGNRSLLGKGVPYISPFLSDHEEWSPKRLRANEGISYVGSYILGMGFTLSEEEAHALIGRDPRNQEVVFPYLNGEDLNSHPEQKSSRWVINFWDWTEEKAATYLEPYKIVKDKVKPERQRRKPDGNYALRKPLPDRWWQYADKRPALYHEIGRGHLFQSHPNEWKSDVRPMEKVIAIAATSRTLRYALVNNNIIFSHALYVIARSSPAYFAVLTSDIHRVWVYKHSSTMKTDLRFSATDVFETYVFPETTPENLIYLITEYEQLRAKIMLRHDVGLSELYNQFNDYQRNDHDICKLRQLQMQIDNAVANSYSWFDLELGHDFHEVAYLSGKDNVRFTIREESRIEILKRLTELNRKRYEEEVRVGQQESSAQITVTKIKNVRRARKAAVADQRMPTPLRAPQPYLPYEEIPAELPLAAEIRRAFEDPEDVILEWLGHHPGWHDRESTLNGSELEQGEFEKGMDYLVNGEFVEIKTENDKEYFKSKK